jgi:hypothetical protein
MRAAGLWEKLTAVRRDFPMRFWRMRMHRRELCGAGDATIGFPIPAPGRSTSAADRSTIKAGNPHPNTRLDRP